MMGLLRVFLDINDDGRHEAKIWCFAAAEVEELYFKQIQGLLQVVMFTPQASNKVFMVGGARQAELSPFSWLLNSNGQDASMSERSGTKLLGSTIDPGF